MEQLTFADTPNPNHSQTQSQSLPDPIPTPNQYNASPPPVPTFLPKCRIVSTAGGEVGARVVFPSISPFPLCMLSTAKSATLLHFPGCKYFEADQQCTSSVPVNRTAAPYWTAGWVWVSAITALMLSQQRRKSVGSALLLLPCQQCRVNPLSKIQKRKHNC